MKFPKSDNILCNAFGQRFLTETKYSVDLRAWDTICRRLISQITSNANKTGVLYEIHMPNKIGYGMKPEEIDSIKDTIESYFKDSDISLTYHI